MPVEVRSTGSEKNNRYIEELTDQCQQGDVHPVTPLGYTPCLLLRVTIHRCIRMYGNMVVCLAGENKQRCAENYSSKPK